MPPPSCTSSPIVEYRSCSDLGGLWQVYSVSPSELHKTASLSIFTTTAIAGAITDNKSFIFICVWMPNTNAVQQLVAYNRHFYIICDYSLMTIYRSGLFTSSVFYSVDITNRVEAQRTWSKSKNRTSFGWNKRNKASKKKTWQESRCCPAMAAFYGYWR